MSANESISEEDFDQDDIQTSSDVVEGGIEPEILDGAREVIDDEHDEDEEDDHDDDDDEDDFVFSTDTGMLLSSVQPKSVLEKRLHEALQKQVQLSERLFQEVKKLKEFCKKRKQPYKRKRKEDGAPVRALSAYNIFMKEKFDQLAQDNKDALKSDKKGAQLKRVPPASVVSSTALAWKELPNDQKRIYLEKAKGDKKRYEEEMAYYNPPRKGVVRKRNKTGYNIFFSSHVAQMKQTSQGIPSERGSIAKTVGNAWKKQTPEQRDHYEQEALRLNKLEAVEGGDNERNVSNLGQSGISSHETLDTHAQRFAASFQHPGLSIGGQQQQQQHFIAHPMFQQGHFSRS